jgi:hypothetical protein
MRQCAPLDEPRTQRRGQFEIDDNTEAQMLLIDVIESIMIAAETYIRYFDFPGGDWGPLFITSEDWA